VNGIFSGSPCSASIRLLVGSHLLLIIQSGLILWSAPPPAMGRLLVWLTLLIGIGAFVCAVRGESAERQPWWKERHRGR
jgi:hypothetical protein